MLGAMLWLPLSAQRHDMRWLGGYAGTNGTSEFGGNMTILNTLDPAYTILREHNLNMRTSVAIYTDDNDSIVAYTDGWSIGDRNFDVMPNGSDLNPSNFFNSTTGLNAQSTHIFLPWPESEDSIALFHMSIDAVAPPSSAYCANRLYLSIIDVNASGGNGDVVSKNNVLAEEYLIAGGLNAVKHANGRDWWVIAHGLGSNAYVSFLLTPTGVIGPWYHWIGSIGYGGNPQSAMSMNGEMLAYCWNLSGLDLLDFDRCTGTLSNWRFIGWPSTSPSFGVAFSGNGNLIYISQVNQVLQAQLIAGTISGIDTVAVWDGFYDTQPQFATGFGRAILAADGRCYLSTSNSTRYMHVIHEPDEQGQNCNLVQHDHWRQTWTRNSIPYRPNYLLGPVPGSECDSLGLSTGGLEPYPVGTARVQPNPSQGSFGITYSGQPTSGEITVLDAAGRIVYRHRLSAWSTLHQVELPPVAPGLYHCRLTWGAKAATLRVVITE